jgi:hypothetical protein
MKDGNIYTILSPKSIQGDSRGVIRRPTKRLYWAKNYAVESLKLSSPFMSLLSKVSLSEQCSFLMSV